jgi:sugar lactone lactonase YvrE
MKTTKMVVILVLALGLATLFALPTVAWSQTAEWTVYNTANSGLPFNGVTALAIDAQGTVWVGTGRWYAFVGGGLAKFDGQNWTVYNTSNSDLPNNDHIGLSIDPHGNIWSGTENGLAKFDGVNWTVYKTHNSGLPDNQTGAPAFDAEGNAWIGTTGGLAKFDGANWTVYNTGNSGLPNNFIWPIAFDAQGNLWIGTFGSGLAKFDGANWTVYNTGNSALPHNRIVSLCVDVQGNVWIGTLEGGLAKFDGANWTVYNTANSELPHNRIWNLAVDPKGNVWAVTMAGLAKFDGVNWTVYDRTNSGLPNNNVYCVAFDAQGNVWIGTESGGLVVYRPMPAVDFNGDEIVDIKDLLILIEYWGQDEPSVDIGPTPSGDGIVDVQDLEVLMSYWQQEVLPVSLLAYWKLDETEGDIAYDSAGENNAVLFGDVIWQPEGGQVDGSLAFDGTDDYLSTDFVLNPADGPFSVFAWIKEGAPGQVIISQTNGAGTGRSWLCTDLSDGKLMTDLRTLGRVGGLPLISESVITDTGWHRIGFVWDGSYRALYIDGTEVAKDTELQANLESAYGGGLYFGAGKNLDAASFFSGLIDDVRIYNRAITP